MKLRMALALCVALGLMAGAATATAGDGGKGRKVAAACKRGGWRHQYRADGKGFKGQQQCVSYAERTGMLKGQAQHECEGLGGTYLGPDSQYGIIWSCINVPYGSGDELNAKFDVLFATCIAERGGPEHSFSTTGTTLDFDC